MEYTKGKVLSAQISLCNAKSDLKESERQLEIARKEVKNAEDAVINERMKQISAKLFLKKVKKRVLLVTRAAVDDSDDEPSHKKTKQDMESKSQCKLCFFPFDDEHPEAVIIPCAHKFCFKCISQLPQKTCPSCRSPFSENNVYRVY
ncbi:Oidioi.mRNA.OKI2018_I69.PAR.g8802.t1.cds [Oikopleura dioica]|uniref:E3 ubiquitin protein ligase n=1 Tax=Oikopleura dioica TaxID=34765 RepID=A0ABN7RIQ9_OIKDI|nr:Oidioi.mRNA.OKI2018_I69.PAR.g8802.t1.cds [Oikopleura dioica]